jgi:hypothetical protein
MNNLTKFGKQILGTAREMGVGNIEIRRRRKHYLLTGKGIRGNIVSMHFATTPSDYRASRNIEAEIRRQLKGRRV